MFIVYFVPRTKSSMVAGYAHPWVHTRIFCVQNNLQVHIGHITWETLLLYYFLPNIYSVFFGRIGIRYLHSSFACDVLCYALNTEYRGVYIKLLFTWENNNIFSVVYISKSTRGGKIFICKMISKFKKFWRCYCVVVYSLFSVISQCGFQNRKG